MKIGALVFLSNLFFPIPDVSGNENDFSKQDKVIICNSVGLAAITAWGLLNWDYFQNDPKKAEEGWFSDDTKNGGYDKLGHFYFSYTLSHILSDFYERSGYCSRQGAFFGSLSSFSLMTFMEIGDSFSSYGFSYEDFFMNLIGTATGYLFYTCPEISEKIDFRLEYRPDFKETDFSTDYEHQKIIMALKFDGFSFAEKHYLKYFELHLGYYTRGYPDTYDRERNVFMAIGINLSRVFKQCSMPKTSKVFNYIQVPYTYIEVNKDLNK